MEKVWSVKSRYDRQVHVLYICYSSCTANERAVIVDVCVYAFVVLFCGFHLENKWTSVRHKTQCQSRNLNICFGCNMKTMTLLLFVFLFNGGRSCLFHSFHLTFNLPYNVCCMVCCITITFRNNFLFVWPSLSLKIGTLKFTDW